MQPRSIWPTYNIYSFYPKQLMSINMDNYINDKNMQKETLLTEINILKDKRKR